jgi:chitin deacetylase
MAQLALTFDDGPGPATPQLLDVLSQHGARATFFLLGTNVERARAVAVRIAREGHQIGNHTFTHARAGAISDVTLVDEIRRTDALLTEVLVEAGVQPSLLPFRLPYGPQPADPRLLALASLGRTHTHWTADFEDWSDPPPEPRELADRMLAHVKAQHANGLAAVLDLHDSSRLYADRGATARAVALLLQAGPFDIFTVPVKP